jgi:hypothetical protein
MHAVRLRSGTAAALLLLCAGCAWGRGKPRAWPPPESGPLWSETFDARTPTWWREEIIRGRTQYTVAEPDGHRCLKAESRGGASMLVTQLQYDPDKFEWLTWEWRVDRVGEPPEDILAGDDAPARVSVFFDTTGLPWDQRRLDYVWSTSGDIGALRVDADNRQAKVFVVDGSLDQLGRWRRVSRNIEDDYRLAFEENPVRVVAIGFMSDTDHTRTEATAFLDNLAVTRRRMP